MSCPKIWAALFFYMLRLAMACPSAPIGRRVALFAPAAALHSAASAAIAQAEGYAGSLRAQYGFAAPTIPRARLSWRKKISII